MNLNNYNFVDLTQTIQPDIPTWESTCGFHSKTLCDYKEGVRVQSFEMLAGIGTHMDAPSHFVPDGISIADIPMRQLINPAMVIDVRKQSHSDYLITAKAILALEKSFHIIPSNSIVLCCTGWSRHWNEPTQYRNQDDAGVMHFPGLSAEAAELLLERNIAGIGIDTLSPDAGNTDFPVHNLLLPANKFIIENLTNIHELPLVGATLLALPIKIQNATEAPCRVVGLVCSD